MLSDYEIENRIGRGGMADVFRARAVRGPWMGQPVAIKRIRPELASDAAYRAQFVSEARLSCQLGEHPHVIRVLETGTDGHGLYIVMEHVNGRDLEQILVRCGERNIPLPVDFACFLAHAVARALDHAHTACDPNGQPLGIVHCDVSPSNVFISSLGEVKLGDFGVARVRRFGDAMASEQAQGKASYLSPEQILGEEVSGASDVFALGAILYELLTGHRAFVGKTHHEVFERILRGRPRPPSDLRPGISPELDAVVMTALCPRRVSGRSSPWGAVGRRFLGPRRVRYSNAKAFGDDLSSHYNPLVGEPLGIAAVVRGLFRSELRLEVT